MLLDDVEMVVGLALGPMVKIVALTIFLSFMFYRLYFSKRSSVQKEIKAPPTLTSAWLPFVGSGVEFAKDSNAFTNKYHKLHGKVFRTKLGLQTTYFIQDLHFASTMARQPHLYDFYDFYKKYIVEIFRINSYINSKQYHENGRKWAQKYLLSKAGVEALVTHYSNNMKEILLEKAGMMENSTIVNLFEFTNPIVFSSATRALFGNYDSSLEEKMICEKLMFFDDYFKYLASGLVPEFLFNRQRRAQDIVTDYLANSLPRDKMTELITNMEDCAAADDRSRVMFMVVWALNANSLPAAFWMMISLLRNKEIYEEVMAEVYKVLKEEIGWDATTATDLPDLQVDVIKKMTLLCSFAKEILRKYSAVSLTRALKKDTVIDLDGEKFFLKKGAAIHCTNPHHNPEIFPQPEKLVPNRFLEGNQFRDTRGKVVALPNMAFGHGASLCPGHKFALLEFPMTCVQLLTCFDWEPVQPNAKTPPPGFGFGCMPLHPEHKKDPALMFRVQVKPQFTKH